MYHTLHPVERDIFLLRQRMFRISQYDARPTGKQPLAMGERSAILTGFSVARGGIGLPGGMTTSSYVYTVSRATALRAARLTSLISLEVPDGKANFPP
jgi:hypothetical protein